MRGHSESCSIHPPAKKATQRSNAEDRTFPLLGGGREVRGLRREADSSEGHVACGQSLEPTSEKSSLELPSHILQVVGLLGILYVFTLKACVKLSC